MHVLLVARAHHHQRHQHHHYPGEPSPRWKCAVSGNFLGDIASWGGVDRHSSSSTRMNSSSCLASAYTAAQQQYGQLLSSPSLPLPLCHPLYRLVVLAPGRQIHEYFIATTHPHQRTRRIQETTLPGHGRVLVLGWVHHNLPGPLASCMRK